MKILEQLRRYDEAGEAGEAGGGGETTGGAAFGVLVVELE